MTSHALKYKKGKSRTVHDMNNESMIEIMIFCSSVQPSDSKPEFIRCIVYVQNKKIKESDLTNRCYQKIKEDPLYNNIDVYLLSHKFNGTSSFGCYPFYYTLDFTINASYKGLTLYEMDRFMDIRLRKFS